MQLEGVVKKLVAKPYKGRKSGTVYSFLLIQDSGEETWITFGFDKEPPFEEGDRINVSADKDKNGFLVYVEGSGRIVHSKSVVQGNQQTNGAQSGASQAAATSTGAQQGSATDRQGQIVWQHSQEMAIAKIGLLLQHDGLPMSSAKTKAGQAQRYAEISASIDKETVKFYNDVLTGRVLQHVADAGIVDTSAADGIPPADGKKQEQPSNGSEY
jgi:hypothetical protein